MPKRTTLIQTILSSLGWFTVFVRFSVEIWPLCYHSVSRIRYPLKPKITLTKMTVEHLLHPDNSTGAPGLSGQIATNICCNMLSQNNWSFRSIQTGHISSVNLISDPLNFSSIMSSSIINWIKIHTKIFQFAVKLLQYAGLLSWPWKIWGHIMSWSRLLKITLTVAVTVLQSWEPCFLVNFNWI